MSRTSKTLVGHAAWLGLIGMWWLLRALQWGGDWWFLFGFTEVMFVLCVAGAITNWKERR